VRIPAMARRRVQPRQDSFCFRDGMDIVVLVNVGVSRSFWCQSRSEVMDLSMVDAINCVSLK